MEPGQAQTRADVGLEEQPQVVQVMLPAVAGIPGRMGRGRCHVAAVGDGGTLQADHGVGAQDELPPALDAAEQHETRGRTRMG